MGDIVTSLNTTLQSGNHLNQLGYELPASEVVVQQIIDHEKVEHQKNILEMEKEGPHFYKDLTVDDSYWGDRSKFYLQMERFIRENNEKIPTWKIAGPLHYGMSPSKMKAVIQQKFREMVASGQLMRKATLMRSQDRTTFYPKTGKGRDNLTRIWGANFLKTNLKEHPKLDTAEHYLLVDDDAIEIEVQVRQRGAGLFNYTLCDYPLLSKIKNAGILSKIIVGKSAAREYLHSQVLKRLNYWDFSDRGNIIRDSNGIGWVVDTEAISFSPPKIDIKYNPLQKYIKKRFDVLFGWDVNIDNKSDYSESNPAYCRTFKIVVSDIGLE